MIIQKKNEGKILFCIWTFSLLASLSASNETQNNFNRFNVTNLANPVIILSSQALIDMTLYPGGLIKIVPRQSRLVLNRLGKCFPFLSIILYRFADNFFPLYRPAKWTNRSQ